MNRKNGVITFKKGASFQDGNANLFIAVLVLTILVIVLFIQQAFIAGLVGTPIVALLVSYALDFNGVQIDLNKKLVRTYSVRLWGKNGKWQDYSSIEKIVLNYESYESEFQDHDQPEEDSEERMTKFFGHFLVYLAGKDLKKQHILSEELSYLDAVQFAKDASEELKIPFIDQYEIRVQASKQQRRR